MSEEFQIKRGGFGGGGGAFVYMGEMRGHHDITAGKNVKMCAIGVREKKPETHGRVWGRHPRGMNKLNS